MEAQPLIETLHSDYLNRMLLEEEGRIDPHARILIETELSRRTLLAVGFYDASQDEYVTRNTQEMHWQVDYRKD
jgi:hypothetical protein